MTNLEKWVLSLTKEDYIKLLSMCVDCHFCPVFDFCDKRPQGKCKDVIREWASREATQDEERNI